MNIFETYQHPPAIVQHLVGIPPEVLRERRRKGFGPMFGRREGGGRWLYSDHDILGFEIANIVMKDGIVLNDALQIGYYAAPIFRDAIVSPTDEFRQRIVIFFNNENSDDPLLNYIVESKVEKIGVHLIHQSGLKFGHLILVDRYLENISSKLVAHIRDAAAWKKAVSEALNKPIERLSTDCDSILFVDPSDGEDE